MQTGKARQERAIGLRKTAAGWSVVEYQILGGKVVKEKVSEPDVRAIALEKLDRDMAIFWSDM